MKPKTNLQKRIKLDSADTSVKFASRLKQLCDWINCWMMFIVAGRGTAKSSDIIAERAIEIIFDMPGAPLAFIADSYVNLDTNILPAVQMGWQRKGFFEGLHYVIGKRPPEEWLKKCSIIVNDFKHTVFWFNGTVIFKGSLDRPSLLAGKSVVHIFADEAKFQPDAKVARAFPILRGDYTLYGDSTYFLGITATTDMPDTTEGEYDWILQYAKRMDKASILRILDTFNIVNNIRIDIYNKEKSSAPKRVLEKLRKELGEWEARLKKVRHEKVFFFNASSLFNIDILTIKYLKGLIESLEPEEFNKSVLGMRPSLKKDMRFYPKLGEQHFYSDGFDYNYYDTQTHEIKESSRGLRYLRHDKPIEAGLDVGNMLSLAIGQEQGKQFRILKEFYEIPDGWFRELGNQFLDFFRSHECKEIDLYFDRAANNFQRQKQDYAGKMKEAIEKDASGNRTGWQVNLKSRGQGNITMEAEYAFMQELMDGKNPNLPQLLIDKYNCKCIKSSMERAPAGVKARGEQKRIVKIKTSERLPPKRLPMESTNFSDAVKYLLCRKDYLSKIKKRKQYNINV